MAEGVRDLEKIQGRDMLAGLLALKSKDKGIFLLWWVRVSILHLQAEEPGLPGTAIRSSLKSWSLRVAIRASFLANPLSKLIH